MRGVWMRVRADLRSRALGVVALGLLIGVAGGAVLTAVAGARRTSSTIDRVVRDTHAADVFVNPDGDVTHGQGKANFAALDKLPGVIGVATSQGVATADLDATGKPVMGRTFASIVLAPVDGGSFRDASGARLVRGRAADPNRADEIEITDAASRRFHLEPGNNLPLAFYTAADTEQIHDPHALPPARATEDFTVSGVVLPLDDAARATDDPKLVPTILLTPAFVRAHPEIDGIYAGKAIRLASGSKGVPAFEAAAQQVLNRNLPASQRHGVNFQELALTRARAERAIRPYVVALWMFAAMAALASVAVLGQIVVRNSRRLREERDMLTALGMTRREFATIGALRGLFIGLLAAAVALVVAYVGSTTMPLGPLRAVEPLRGMQADSTVFVVGAALLVALCTGVSAGAVLVRTRRSKRRRSALGEELARAGAPVPLSSGVRFAFDRGADKSIPLGSTLFGVVIALSALVATAVFGSALTRFVDTPARYGWEWTSQIEGGFDSAAAVHKAVTALSKRPDIASVTPLVYSQFAIGGRSVAAVGLDTSAGGPFVPLLSGSVPQRDDEIVVGEATLRSLHKKIGDSVVVEVQGHGEQRTRRVYRIVGTAVFPRFAPYPASEPTGLGIGAATTLQSIARMNAVLGNPALLLRAKPGATIDNAAVQHLLFGPAAGLAGEMYVGPQRPNDVLSYDKLTRTPLALAAVLGLLAIGSSAHLLVTGVRSRRRDIALLKTFGLTRRQSLSALIVQAAVLIVVALIVAIPIGALAGRWLWVETARWLGIADDVTLPLTGIGLIAGAALGGAVLLATGPGLIASRIRPAVALRAE